MTKKAVYIQGVPTVVDQEAGVLEAQVEKLVDDIDSDININPKTFPVAERPSAKPPALQAGAYGVSTNLNMASWQGRATFLAAGNPGNLVFSEDGRIEMVAVSYVIFPDQGLDPETGEVHEFTRCALIDADGNVFRTTAAHAPQRMAWVLSLFSPEDWAEGIPFIILERRSRKTGRTYHDIRVATSRS